MSLCPGCGTVNPDAARACGACGRHLRAAGARAVIDAGQTGAPGTSPDATTPMARRADAPHAPLSPGQTFGVRYHVIRQLGFGGMGAVYQAWDAELGVAVALKVIRLDLLADAHDALELERRFKRELLLARQVTHRNVVRIHDLGEVDGIKYITMPYIEGEDLGQRLQRAGPQPAAAVLAIARQVASGLQAAHEVGVVHRDLKPANIMMAGEDRALIMDFGIARSVEPGMTSGTALGTVIGTIDYMAPEQARGEHVDHRADIYAFGLILYDLLLGPRPQAATPLAGLMARLQESPAPPRSVAPHVPEALSRVIETCLQIDPSARYQTTGELVAALDGCADGTARRIEPVPAAPPRPRARWAAAAVLGAVLLVGTTWWAARGTGTTATTAARDPVSVLVADFTNSTGDPVFEGSLEQVLGLGVEGSAFVTSYSRQAGARVAAQIGAGPTLTPEAARLVSVREGIKVVISGEIAPEGAGYAIAVRAIDPAAGTQIASVRTTADSKAQVLDAVQDLAIEVRQSLGDVTIDAGHTGGRETFTAGSLEAARAYAQAQALAASGREQDAIALYKEALTHDANMGRAHASWAVAAYRLGDRETAEAQWKSALALMDRMTDRERYRTLGTYYFGVTRNYELAVETYEALLQRYPFDGAGLTNLGLAYFETLNLPKAIEQGRRAVQVYPKNTLSRQNLALFLMYGGQFDAAVQEAKQVIAGNAAFAKAHLPVAMAALAAGRLDDARQAYASMAAASPRGAALAPVGLADVAMYEGDLAGAERVVRNALAKPAPGETARDQALLQVLLAEVLAAGGRRVEALEAARAAIKLSSSDDVNVPAALVLLGGGQPREAEAIAAAMDQNLQKRTRALAKLIHAEAALARGRTTEAVDLLMEAKALADIWPVRFALGRLLTDAGRYADALAELDACSRRTGEAAAMFLTDVPSFRAMAPLRYWLARTQDGLGMKDAAAASYEMFLTLRQKLPGDALAARARERLATF